MKVVSDVLGAARSDVAELMRSGSRSRGPYRRADAEAVLIAICAITNVRMTYGYCHLTATLNRAQRATGEEALNLAHCIAPLLLPKISGARVYPAIPRSLTRRKPLYAKMRLACSSSGGPCAPGSEATHG